jgi:hypothetical protein
MKAGGYDRLLQLLWLGPVSAPRTPNHITDMSFPSYISVGARDGRLWVYIKEVSPIRQDQLKAALLDAIKNPRKLYLRPVSAGQKSGIVIIMETLRAGRSTARPTFEQVIIGITGILHRCL